MNGANNTKVQRKVNGVADHRLCVVRDRLETPGEVLRRCGLRHIRYNKNICLHKWKGEGKARDKPNILS